MRSVLGRMAARLLLRSATRAAVYSRRPLPSQAVIRGLASGGTVRSMALFSARVWAVCAGKYSLDRQPV